MMLTRVMLIDGTPARGALVKQALKDAGYDVVARLSVNDDLIEALSRVQPDIIIVDLESPDRDTLESLRHISQDHPRPIVMFAERSDPETTEKAIKAGVSAYVVAGLSKRRIKPVIDVAIARFREFQALRKELEDTKNKLAERKVVDKAKGILMKQRGMSEEEAYGALRKLAMDQNITLGQAARNFLAVAQLMDG